MSMNKVNDIFQGAIIEVSQKKVIEAYDKIAKLIDNLPEDDQNVTMLMLSGLTQRISWL